MLSYLTSSPSAFRCVVRGVDCAEALHRGHEAVNPAVPVVAQRVVALLAYALHGPATSHLPSSCAGPIRIGLAHYLAGLPPSYREEVPVEVQAQLQ